MTRKPDCSTCTYADPHIGDDGSVFTECHRYPPQVIAGEGPDGVAPVMMWPQVHDGDWCGEYEEVSR